MSEEKYVDMHNHTNYSDGSFSPSEVVDKAKETGLSAIAITDHDRLSGLDEAKKRADEVGIELIRGVELSCFDKEIKKSVHILGLLIKDDNKLEGVLKKVQELRMKNCLALAKAFKEQKGLEISEKDFIETPSFTSVLLKKGYAKTLPEAETYKQEAGSKGFGIDIKDAISAIHEAGGLAVIAHPGTLKLPEDKVFAKFEEYKSYGLDAIECLHSKHSKTQSDFFIKSADKLGLLVSGGSDFHGEFSPGVFIGKGKGDDFMVSYRYLEQMKEKSRQNEQNVNLMRHMKNNGNRR